MWNRIIFLASMCIASEVWASQLIVPVEPFSKRFEDAVMVVHGQVAQVDPARVKIDFFDGFAKETVKRATLKVLKQWKGKAVTNVEFYFANDPSLAFTEENLDLLKKASSTIQEKFEVLVYLREESGHFFGSGSLGMFVKGVDPVKMSNKTEYKALDLMAKGKKKEAILTCKRKCAGER